MKYIAAYALLVLGGNETPCMHVLSAFSNPWLADADVRKVLQEIGGEVNEEELTRVVNALKGKQLHEVRKTIVDVNVNFSGYCCRI